MSPPRRRQAVRPMGVGVLWIPIASGVWVQAASSSSAGACTKVLEGLQGRPGAVTCRRASMVSQ